MLRLASTWKFLRDAACVLTLLLVISGAARGDILYGSSATGNNSIWQIDTQTHVATQLIGNLPVTPNSLATNAAARQLYFGDSNGTTLWRLDLDTLATTQIYDLSKVLDGLNGPTLADGGSFIKGDYYLLVQRTLAQGDVGGGTTLYRANLSSDGLTVDSIDQFAINTTFGRSIGDLGDFAIDANGIAHGNSWDPPNGDTQIGGYWTFDVTDPSNTFSLVQNTRSLGNNQPTYQLAYNGARSTLYGVDFFTPTRLDTLSYGSGGVTITAGSTLTGFTGTQFNDLSDAIATPEPASLLLCATFLVAVGVLRRRRSLSRELSSEGV